MAGPPDMSRPGTEMPRKHGRSTGKERDRARKGRGKGAERARKGHGKGTEMPRTRIDD